MHERDQQLVQSILSGSVDAWHQFVHEYGTLIQSVVRRHLFGDEDEIRTVFVQVLETLYKQSFATYEGRASLSTWTALVARGKTLDYVRAKLGRKRAPAAIEQLGPVDQGVFQYHFVEGLPLEAVSSRLASEGHHTTFEELLGSVEQVELPTECDFGDEPAELPAPADVKPEARPQRVAVGEEEGHPEVHTRLAHEALGRLLLLGGRGDVDLRNRFRGGEFGGEVVGGFSLRVRRRGERGRGEGEGEKGGSERDAHGKTRAERKMDVTASRRLGRHQQGAS